MRLRDNNAGSLYTDTVLDYIITIENNFKEVILQITRSMLYLEKKQSSQTWGKRLLQLVSLLRVKDAESVQIFRTTDLELYHIFAPLYLHRTCILPSSSEKKILNLVYLLRLRSYIQTKVN